MALALETGYVSPKKMLREMTLREVGTWAALWQIDPWGQERADLRAGTIAYVTAEVHRSPKRRPAPYKPRDFMPYAQQDSKANARDLSARLKAAFKGRRS